MLTLAFSSAMTPRFLRLAPQSCYVYVLSRPSASHPNAEGLASGWDTAGFNVPPYKQIWSELVPWDNRHNTTWFTKRQSLSVDWWKQAAIINHNNLYLRVSGWEARDAWENGISIWRPGMRRCWFKHKTAEGKLVTAQNSFLTVGLSQNKHIICLTTVMFHLCLISF